jgi:uncharacterized protein YbjT (DUF2867 family)
MKIVVIGGTGLIGSKLVGHLGDQGNDAVSASPASGVDTLTGDGLDEVLTSAEVVVDVSNSPQLEGPAVLEFFETSTGNLMKAEATAGVSHHVALSVVGTERLSESSYFLAKQAQEQLIAASDIPYSIVHATQFFEFIGRIADGATDGGVVHLAPVLIQPMAADDVARGVAEVAVGPPLNGIVDIAGPDVYRLDELIRQRLADQGDPREVVADPSARYFGALLEERTLVPTGEARLGATHLEDWTG